MEEWKDYKLGDLIVLSSGGTPNKSNSSYWDGNIPWISARAMYDDYLYSSNMTITREGLKNGSKLAPVNSILLLTRGSGLFNRIPVCLVKREMAFNQDVKCIESINQDIVSNLFLFYWLIGNKQEISNILETTGIGAGKIDTERLKSIHITLPPIQTQQILIKFAESLMLKIEVNRRINDNLVQQAQALFKSWFVDFEPFKDGELVESELGMIPKGWRVGLLSEIASYSTQKIETKSLTNENYYSTENILPDKNGVINASSLPLTDVVTRCKLGDTIISNIRPYFKKIFYCNKEVAGCSADVLCFVPSSPLLSRYLYLLLYDDVFFDYMMASVKGTKMPRGDKKHIMKYSINIPPTKVLNDFNTIASPILFMVEKNRKESSHLAAIRDTLLPRLMSGELKVNEITI